MLCAASGQSVKGHLMKDHRKIFLETCDIF